ncbi:SH2 domain-containing protein 5 isoform X2 [Microcaecilia unicolor]|uniref:SH2 domain-containing protein 5 isoform X2 n=1 Tax=Microcaecilia unicolor TaxID=1415580 RepID=A0A6P7WNP5_9AMPH|nr:SH2 domain-containing protein 5 isoform X2 [Microcaecilia unicolor]
MRKKAEHGRSAECRLPQARVITKFLEGCTRRLSVILKFSVQGVKMYSADGETLLMAHALPRILYTTCRPRDCQFAFVARNPQSPSHELFCHLYVGSQSSEVQLWNLLLCRSFQLHYQAVHPGEQEPSCMEPARPPERGAGVAREPLDSEISQNVDALVSFRRLPGTSVKEVNGVRSNPRNTAQGNPYCSPTLVRKKAIRSKAIRSGAYRCTSYNAQLQRPVQGTPQPGRCSNVTQLSENEGLLQEMVWSFAGICRDSATSLLRREALGAFLLQKEPDSASWTLAVRTLCGIIPYQVLKSELGTYSLEHLSEEFPSLAALLEQHSTPESGLFDCLDLGRVHHCYEEQDCRPSWTLGHQSPTLQITQEPDPNAKTVA